MDKKSKFSGKPILSQVLDFIPKDLAYRTAKALNADRYSMSKCMYLKQYTRAYINTIDLFYFN